MGKGTAGASVAAAAATDADTEGRGGGLLAVATAGAETSIRSAMSSSSRARFIDAVSGFGVALSNPCDDVAEVNAPTSVIDDAPEGNASTLGIDDVPEGNASTSGIDDFPEGNASTSGVGGIGISVPGKGSSNGWAFSRRISSGERSVGVSPIIQVSSTTIVGTDEPEVTTSVGVGLSFAQLVGDRDMARMHDKPREIWQHVELSFATLPYFFFSIISTSSSSYQKIKSNCSFDNQSMCKLNVVTNSLTKHLKEPKQLQKLHNYCIFIPTFWTWTQLSLSKLNKLKIIIIILLKAGPQCHTFFRRCWQIICGQLMSLKPKTFLPGPLEQTPFFWTDFHLIFLGPRDLLKRSSLRFLQKKPRNPPRNQIMFSFYVGLAFGVGVRSLSINYCQLSFTNYRVQSSQKIQKPKVKPTSTSKSQPPLITKTSCTEKRNHGKNSAITQNFQSKLQTRPPC